MKSLLIDGDIAPELFHRHHKVRRRLRPGHVLNGRIFGRGRFNAAREEEAPLDGGLFAELPVVMAEPMGEGAGSQG